MSLEARFQLREKLGEGATSEVYAAYDRNLRRPVAIKLFKKFDRGGEFATLKERFLVDARAAAGLSHPNIVTIYDAGSFGDGIAIVMELVKDSLRKLLDRVPQPPLETAVAIGAQVADGLRCLHANGIFHRVDGVFGHFLEDSSKGANFSTPWLALLRKMRLFTAREILTA